MRVNSLAFDIHQASNTKASSPKEPKQAPEVSAKAEPVQSDRPVEPVQPPQKAIVNGLGLSLSFTVDQETGRSIISVIDIETGEVVRQIPPEEVLNFLKQYQEQNGLLLSRRL